MSFFQATVSKKYANNLNKEVLRTAYTVFRSHFHNAAIQENIRNSKEEQYQEGFFRDLFVKVLGYIQNPEPNFNLITEKKNEKDSKKSDGAIIINGIVTAVIELKGTDTTDLAKIETQAFGYKNNQANCTYVITSNFEKLWFYIDNAIDHLEFNLFTLTEAEFELLYLCLSFESLQANIPQKIKAESLSEEDNITKKLYKDYSLFKRELHQNLVQLNPEFDALTLFKKSQKLLDRFLFLFFAEDRNLLPPNSVRLVLNDWRDLQERDEHTPLYSRFKKYFGYLNTGFKGKRYDVFAYNGGLFKPDELLDAISIDDELLFKHTHKLSEYNFESEVDVNILGHIFENSLNELDEIQAQLEGQEIEKSKTKRKKDGVFYTPKYITKYIVENTVGKLCIDKKTALELKDEDFVKKTGKAREPFFDKLKNYREWLLQLTICDPACGSGAFLNQALDFLINEHKYLDELQAKLFGDAILLNDVSKSILENNLFGVDLNEESVEIAKLSLWLRTAQPNRKLNDLNSNIKCGNSLIDDPEIAGEKAFNWNEEFPQVFEKGGFDIIIGNPPYVTRGIPDSLKDALKSKYFTAQYQLDLYVLFIEKGINILNSSSSISYIVPNSWLKNMMMSDCRKFILSNIYLTEIIPSLESVFPDASVDTLIFVGSKAEKDGKINISEFNDSIIKFKHQISLDRILKNDGFILDVEVSEKILPIMEKMRFGTVNIEKIFDVIRGINPYDSYTGQSKEIIENRAYHESYKKDETFVPELKGMHISRYNYYWDKKHYISYGSWLAAPRELMYFEGERIVFREILGKTLVSTLITEDFKIDRSLYIAKILESEIENFDIKYVLSILNSKLLAFFFRFSNNEFDNLFPKIRVAEFKKLPIKNIPKIQQLDLKIVVDNLLENQVRLQNINQKFIGSLIRKFSEIQLSKKLENWYALTYKEFIAELAKKKIKLGLAEEAEWEDYFSAEAQKALSIKAEIDKTDKEIDAMVYQLYGLTDEEIKIVEGN